MTEIRPEAAAVFADGTVATSDVCAADWTVHGTELMVNITTAEILPKLVPDRVMVAPVVGPVKGDTAVTVGAR